MADALDVVIVVCVVVGSLTCLFVVLILFWAWRYDRFNRSTFFRGGIKDPHQRVDNDDYIGELDNGEGTSSSANNQNNKTSLSGHDQQELSRDESKRRDNMSGLDGLDGNQMNYPSEIGMESLGYAESVISEDYNAPMEGSVRHGGSSNYSFSDRHIGHHDSGESVGSGVASYGYSLEGASLATPMPSDIARLESNDSNLVSRRGVVALNGTVPRDEDVAGQYGSDDVRVAAMGDGGDDRGNNDYVDHDGMSDAFGTGGQSTDEAFNVAYGTDDAGPDYGTAPDVGDKHANLVESPLDDHAVDKENNDGDDYGVGADYEDDGDDHLVRGIARPTAAAANREDAGDEMSGSQDRVVDDSSLFYDEDGEGGKTGSINHHLDATGTRDAVPSVLYDTSGDTETDNALLDDVVRHTDNAEDEIPTHDADTGSSSAVPSGKAENDGDANEFRTNGDGSDAINAGTSDSVARTYDGDDANEFLTNGDGSDAMNAGTSDTVARTYGDANEFLTSGDGSDAMNAGTSDTAARTYDGDANEIHTNGDGSDAMNAGTSDTVARPYDGDANEISTNGDVNGDGSDVFNAGTSDTVARTHDGDASEIRTNGDGSDAINAGTSDTVA